jgi:two-component system, NarL family, nitrate/nitrite response regulator NarL
MKTSVAIVEDDDFTRFTLASAIRQLDCDVVFDSASAQVALREITRLKPDLAVVDLHLGTGPTGLDLARNLKLNLPNLAVIVLSSFEDPRLLNPNLPDVPAGVIYLTKAAITDLKDLRSSITKALNARDTAFAIWPSTSSSLAGLSAVQLDTLRLMAQGLSNSEIAKRRFVTEKSVEIAISRIAKKLGVQKDSTINQRVHIANVFFSSHQTIVE